MKGWAKVKDLFWYSDSEPNEVLISMCHSVCLPIAIWAESDDPSFLLMFLGACAGMFQLWAVIWNGYTKVQINRSSDSDTNSNYDYNKFMYGWSYDW